MIKELFGNLPIIVQLFVGLAALFGVALLAGAFLRLFRNVIRFRMPQPYLGNGPNIEWAEEKRLEIAAGQYRRNEDAQLPNGELLDHGVGVEHGQHSLDAAPPEIRPDLEDNGGKSSESEVIMTSTPIRPATQSYNDGRWAERILRNREN